MPIEGRREYPRTKFIRTVRYYVEEFEKPYATGVSVDISEGGLGMITEYPLKTGDILFFLDEIKINKIVAKASIVRWIRGIENNRYLAGMQLVK